MYPKIEICQNLLCRSLPQTKGPRSQVVAKRFWASLWQFLRGSPLPPCKSQLSSLSLISFQYSSSGTQWLRSCLWGVLGRFSSSDASSKSSQSNTNPSTPSTSLIAIFLCYQAGQPNIQPTLFTILDISAGFLSWYFTSQGLCMLPLVIRSGAGIFGSEDVKIRWGKKKEIKIRWIGKRVNRWVTKAHFFS